MDGKVQSITTIFIISYEVESIAKIIIIICNYMFRPFRPSFFFILIRQTARSTQWEVLVIGDEISFPMVVYIVE
jgi:hypothetical protein